MLKVFDGDTFLVLLQGQEEHVRLREIDATGRDVTPARPAGSAIGAVASRPAASAPARAVTPPAAPSAPSAPPPGPAVQTRKAAPPAAEMPKPPQERELN